jgi:protein-tyrosine phosphatase
LSASVDRVDRRGLETRRILLENAFNFRDVGGVAVEHGGRVRRGWVYRSDGLHRIGAADVEILARLGITDVFDLRSDSELARDGVGPFAGEHARHHHVPLVKRSLSPFDPDIDWRTVNLRDRYVEMLEEGGPSIRTIFDALAESGGAPIVFHCSGGKDRTGVVAALLQRTLGVSDEVVVDDYSSSESHLRAATTDLRAGLDGLGLDETAIAYLTSSPPERMRYTLAELDRRWGSTARYLRSIGVAERTETEIRAKLVESSSR